MSLLKKPEKPGTPAIASVAIRKVTKVIGIFFRRPPISRMSWLWTAWMTDPEPRKRHALKNAWVVRWNSPAVKPPTPSPMIM